jgi:translation initiation factor IF-2
LAATKTVAEIAKIIQYEPEVLLKLLKEIDPSVNDVDSVVSGEQYRLLTQAIKKKKQAPSKSTQKFVSTQKILAKEALQKKEQKPIAKENEAKINHQPAVEPKEEPAQPAFERFAEKAIETVDAMPEIKKKPKKKGPGAQIEKAPEPVVEKPVFNTNKTLFLKPLMTPKELAHQMGIKEKELIKALFKMNIMITVNQHIDQDTAQLVAEELGFTCKVANEEYQELDYAANIHDELDLKPRNVVVTIMGHVDHGKTSLLDYIRSTRVQAKEAGGITQHIGAYEVKTDVGNITFLDTPGHEAFTAMRARGAKITDIVILIVAADDGIMPQTQEAIKHAKAAGVPIIVAINKCDKPNVDLEKVKNQLTQYDLTPEEWGGETMVVPISAKTGEGVDALLEGISLNAEMLDLKAPVNGPIQAFVIESRLEKGRGTVVSLLIQSGTLNIGDIVLADQTFGRIRSIMDDQGKRLDCATPGMPIEVTGLATPPNAGDKVIVVDSEKKARQLADERINQSKQQKTFEQQKTMLDIFTNIKEHQNNTVLNVIVKADVHGSIEAIEDALSKVGNEEASVKVISSGVGAITENDANLALSSGAVLIGFNVRADAIARKIIEQHSELNVFYFNIIYNLIEKVTNALKGLVGPLKDEKIIGYALVKAVFSSSTFGAIAGCTVTEGLLKKDAPIRVLRNDIVIFEGKLESLRHYQSNVKEVKAGSECGVGVQDYNDIKENDQIEAFEIIEKEVVF